MNILFICDGNVARSQEAALFLNAMIGTRHHATSAGTDPKIGKPIDPAVVQVMSELGYSMEQAYRKPLDIYEAKHADLVISFKGPEDLPEELASLHTVRYWSIPDPKGKPLAFHREIRDRIQAKVAGLVSELNL